MIKLRNICFIGLLSLLCCRKPYNPPAITSKTSYLVVDGVINLSVDSTVIKISRTVNLNNKTAINPELGADVTIEGEQQYVTHIDDRFNDGHYFIYDINLPTNQRYRLRIKTKDGKEYLSDFIDIKPTPPIDSVGYNIQNGKVVVYVNSHDPASSTHYYRWDYEEVWKFHSKYPSYYVLDPNINSIVPRPTPLSACYASDFSSNILINSTTKLSKDEVYQSPLTYIPLTSEKMEAEYSILVKQYALNQAAFEFYQNMQKNSEQLGSIFDAQPTQFTTGNIHNIKDPKEPVIGYISMTNIETKRIFISHDALPGNVLPIYPYDCEQDSALFTSRQGENQVQNVLINPPAVYIPTTGIFVQGNLVGYQYSTPECADCSLRGTTQPPYYWPQN